MTRGAAAAKPDYPLVEFRPAADNGPRWGRSPLRADMPAARRRLRRCHVRRPDRPRRTVRIPAARFWPG